MGLMQENYDVAKPVFPIRNTDLGKRPIKIPIIGVSRRVHVYSLTKHLR